MCRNIHTLYNYEPPATEDEIRDAALQYVRKISGFTKPSRVNEEAFDRAVDDVAALVVEVEAVERGAVVRDLDRVVGAPDRAEARHAGRLHAFRDVERDPEREARAVLADETSVSLGAERVQSEPALRDEDRLAELGVMGRGDDPHRCRA